MLKEEARKNQQYDEDEVSRIIRSRNLIILAHVEDQNTRQLFESQSNIYCNMSLRNYSDCDEFKVMLKEGLKDDQDFVIAVAPAGSGDN